jgi:hypothetical protein
VDVLEHEYGGSPASELADELGHNFVGSGTVLDHPRQLSAHDLRDFEERAERPRREQGITRPPHDPRAVSGVLTEAAQQRGLAYTRLTGNEDEAPATRLLHGGERLRQQRELVGSFQELD